MKRYHLNSFCGLLLILILGSAVPATAQEPSTPPPGTPSGEDATLILDGKARSQVRLAFPAAELDPSLSGDFRYAAQEIEQTLRDDLVASRIFNIQGPTELSVLVLTGNRDHDFEQYRSLGNDVILLATIKQEGDRLVLEGRVYDLPSRQSIAGKRYRGELDQGRRVAHTLADEVHRLFTGRPGIALTSIAFHSTRDGHQELYLMDYDGRNQRRISGHKSTSGFVDWSPTGDAIAYMSYFTGNPGIHLVELASGRKIPLVQDGILNLSPSFSPDGQEVVFARAGEDANIDLYLCSRNCQTPRRLTQAQSIDTNPSFSPSGKQIAFTSDRSGKPNIYVMNRDGSDVQRLSFEGDYNDGAAWRPDGSQIAYASRKQQQDNRFQLLVTSLVDLTTKVLAAGPDSYEEPSYSPDGQYIAFTLKRGKESQIYVMDVQSGQLRQLTHEGNSFAADWSPYPAK